MNDDKVKLLKSSLTPRQSKSLEAVHWLYYGERRTGRTYLLCIGAIIFAITHPGENVKVYTHNMNGTFQNIDERIRIIEDIKIKYDLDNLKILKDINRISIIWKEIKND